MAASNFLLVAFAASASYEAWRQFARTGDSPWDTFTPASWVFYAIAFAWAIWMRRGSRLAWRVTFALCTAMIAGTAFFYLPQVFPARHPGAIDGGEAAVYLACIGAAWWLAAQRLIRGQKTNFRASSEPSGRN